MNHTVYVIYFTLPGARDFAPLLRRCLLGLISHWPALGSSVEDIKVLTDEATEVPSNLIGTRNVVRVDTSPYVAQFFRQGNQGSAFDYKSCLIMALMERRSRIKEFRPFITLDCDNIIKGDFITPLERIVGNDTMCIGKDPGEREIFHPYWKGAVTEESSSILVFPQGDTASIGDEYRRLWTASSEPGHFLLEQRTWTLVTHTEMGLVLPHEYSWSRVWDGSHIGRKPNPILIKHPHGEEKWEGIE